MQLKAEKLSGKLGGKCGKAHGVVENACFFSISRHDLAVYNLRYIQDGEKRTKENRMNFILS